MPMWLKILLGLFVLAFVIIILWASYGQFISHTT